MSSQDAPTARTDRRYRRRRGPALVVALWAIAAVVAASGLPRLRADNAPERFFIRDARALARESKLTRELGAPAALRIGAAGQALWTAEGLRWLGDLEEELRGIRGVLGAAGIAGLRRAEGRPWPPTDPLQARDEARADPLTTNTGWISSDGEVATVLLLVRHLEPRARRRMLAEIGTSLAGAPPGVEAWMAGLPTINEALDDGISGLARTIFPAVLLVVLVVLAVALDGARDLLRPMVVVAVCLVTTFGLMGWLQPSIDMVTVLVAPIVCVVGLAAAVHVEMSFRRRLRERPDDVAAALDATYREKRWPIVWSGVTTAVGFGSLVAARVPPVRALGAWCTFGIALVTLALLTLQPALIRLRSARRARLSRYEAWAGPFGRRLVAAAMAQPGRVALGFTLATLVAAVGALRIDLGTNVLDYLPRGSPVRTGLEGLEAHGVGAMAVDLALALPATDGEGFRSPLLTARLGELSRDLRDEPHVLAALSYFELAGRGLESPAGSLLRAGRGLLISRDGSLTRVRLLVPMLGFSQLDPVLERAVARARRAFPEAEVWAGGDYVHVLEAQRSLLATMFVSLALTATIIALILFFLLGGGRRALAALLPNLLPPLLVVGLMGWLGMPLDSSTVMIGAVVLGLAVDDTLHTFGQYRLRVRSLPPAAAIEATYERVAPAHMLTSLVLAAGLGICGFADLRPISHFGALSAAAVAGALLGDLLLLPVLLRGRPRRAA